MTSARYLALIDDLDISIWRSWTTKRTRRPARKELRKHVRRAHRRMRRALDEALSGDGPTDEQLHEVRKAAKRVRYAAESVSDVYGSKASKLAATMEERPRNARRSSRHRRHPRVLRRLGRRGDQRRREQLHLRPAARPRTSSRRPRQARLPRRRRRRMGRPAELAPLSSASGRRLYARRQWGRRPPGWCLSHSRPERQFAPSRRPMFTAPSTSTESHPGRGERAG